MRALEDLSSLSETARIPLVRIEGSLPRRRKVVAVIPAHNEVDQIDATLAAIFGQTRVPDEVYVSTDNAEGDALADAAAQWPAAITCTVGNTDRKAGNLNRILAPLLRDLDDDDVVMGFDADSVPGRRFVANALRWLDRGYGAVGATFHARGGGGVLGQLQRSEFARFARHQHRKRKCDVLSGTGWAIPAWALRMVAASRPVGQVYDVRAITEDYELTLRIRQLGIRTIAPSDCPVITDVMTTLRDWGSQRLRWQEGTLRVLGDYGWCVITREMIIRQLLTYLFMLATPLTIGYLAWSFALFGVRGIDPANAPLYACGIGFVVTEQAWQARKAGWRAVVMTLLILPDFCYSVARQVVYIRALYRLLTRKHSPATWGAGTSL
jgi:cellulose synthase/poly-beta-1,6-N-acetylglucosamine synthase-like glycosyltransferase